MIIHIELIYILGYFYSPLYCLQKQCVFWYCHALFGFEVLAKSIVLEASFRSLDMRAIFLILRIIDHFHLLFPWKGQSQVTHCSCFISYNADSCPDTTYITNSYSFQMCKITICKRGITIYRNYNFPVKTIKWYEGRESWLVWCRCTRTLTKLFVHDTWKDSRVITIIIGLRRGGLSYGILFNWLLY